MPALRLLLDDDSGENVFFFGANSHRRPLPPRRKIGDGEWQEEAGNASCTAHRDTVFSSQRPSSCPRTGFPETGKNPSRGRHADLNGNCSALESRLFALAVYARSTSPPGLENAI